MTYFKLSNQYVIYGTTRDKKMDEMCPTFIKQTITVQAPIILEKQNDKGLTSCV